MTDIMSTVCAGIKYYLLMIMANQRQSGSGGSQA